MSTNDSMAGVVLTFSLIRLALCALLIIWSNPEQFTSSACSNFKSIINFGDSASDTGNAGYLYESSHKPPPNFLFSPYGQTFFHHPTGRCSDGRLVLDFIAQESGLPFVAPFYGERKLEHGISGSSYLNGVNFAVAGATAMEDSFFNEMGVQIPLANVSLTAQLGWFKEYMFQNCQASSECKKILENSLVLLGEIGGNDYNYALLQGKNLVEIRSFVPDVIKVIGSAINELVKLGAMTLMVPGLFPFGCSPAYLTLFKSWNEQDYDPNTGCLNWPNRFVEHHNELLQLELNHIRKIHPETKILYADYYHAQLELCSSPIKYGFTRGALRACCGGGKEPYNVNMSVQCGNKGSNSCEDPHLFVNWDGVHLTETAYKWIALALLDGSYTSPPFTQICPSISDH